ncbi:pseudouridine synthase [Mycena alexandri]|uniref:Pseudouridine synthase n=1 Tax=Mycena alexandri TaxID=1745969 RepID=A0AAD6WSM4_9AGAR|nr:pseudouridine synthase [Mycena alexandri]
MNYRRKLAENAFRWSRNILYVDRSLIVLNKPPGLVSQIDPTTTKAEGGNLAKFLDDVKQSLELPSPPYGVHRLDKGTTGCLLLPLNSSLVQDLSQRFRTEQINKTYLALVRGTSQDFPQKSGEIQTLLEYPNGRPTITRQEGPGTQEATTKWELVASSPRVPLSLLRLTPLTGRKHQLRVHLNEVLRTPILGDTQHFQGFPSGSATLNVALPRDRLFLHASQISLFRFRRSGGKKRFMLRFCAPLPQDWVELCSEADIPLSEYERFGGLSKSESGKEEDFEHITEIPDLNGYWIP